MRPAQVLRSVTGGLAVDVLTDVFPAQSAPDVVNFQARLVHNVDGPLVGNVSLTVRIYDVPTGGVPLWEETQSAVAVNGIVNLLLGGVSALSADLFTGGERYLALQVGGDAEMTPRQLIGSTPYAPQAANTDDVAGRDIHPNSVTVNGLLVINPFGEWVGSAAGLQGPMGPQGPAGADGATGAQGLPGPQGPQGPQGLAGPKGPAGAEGARGFVGPQGAAGPQGVAGPQGDIGPAGLAGTHGAVGPIGPQG